MIDEGDGDGEGRGRGKWPPNRGRAALSKYVTGARDRRGDGVIVFVRTGVGATPCGVVVSVVKRLFIVTGGRDTRYEGKSRGIALQAFLAEIGH